MKHHDYGQKVRNYVLCLRIRPRKRTIIVSSVLFIVFLLLLYVSSSQEIQPSFTHGHLVLDSPDIESLALAGGWAFYRQNLSPGPKDTPEFIITPSTWKNNLGYGTYRLEIEGLAPSQEYALHLPYQATAFEASFNGKPIYANGTVGTDRQTSHPAYQPQIIVLQNVTGHDELEIKVSNFHHRRGGIFQAIHLGDPKRLGGDLSLRLTADWTFVIAYSLMGLYQIGFALLRKDKTCGYLALFFFSLALNGFVGTSEVLIFKVFPYFSWEIFQKLCYTASYMAPVWLFLFANTYTFHFTRIQEKWAMAPFLAIMLFVLVTPASVFSRYNLIFQLLTLLALSLICGTLVQAVFENRPGSRSVFVGHLIFCSVVVSSILFSNGQISGGTYLPLSFLKSFNIPWFKNMPMSLDILSYILTLVLINIYSLAYFIRNPHFMTSVDQEEQQIQAATGEIADSTPTKSKSETCDLMKFADIALSYGLSCRESEIATLMLQGKTNIDIANILFISTNTVKTHVSKIFRKTNIENRSQLYAVFNRGITD